MYKVISTQGGTASYYQYLEDELNKLEQQGFRVVCSVGDNLILHLEEYEYASLGMEDYPSQGC